MEEVVSSAASVKQNLWKPFQAEIDTKRDQ